MTPIHCQHSLHSGDRLIDRRHALERRIEFRRMTDQGRERVLMDRIVCRACMAVEVAGTRGEAQAGML